MEADMKAMLAMLVMMVMMAVGGCEEGYTYDPDEPEPNIGFGSSCSVLPCEEGVTCYTLPPLNPDGPQRKLCHRTCDLEAELGDAKFCGACEPQDEDERSPYHLGTDVALCRPRAVPLGDPCRWSDECDEGACWDGVCSYGPPPED